MADRGEHEPLPGAEFTISCPTDPYDDWTRLKVSVYFDDNIVPRIAIDPIFPPPPVPPNKRHQIPDAQDNRFELVFNERDDAAELKNLPIDDTINGIIEEDELEDEATEEEDLDENHPWMYAASRPIQTLTQTNPNWQAKSCIFGYHPLAI